MYKLLPNDPLTNTPVNAVKKLEGPTFVPFDNNNLDYQKYLKWLDGYEYINDVWVKTSNGNTPLPADE